MIKINALYLLLLIECVVVLAAATVLFALRGKKSNDSYRAGLADQERMKAAQQEMQKHPEQNPSEASPQAGAASSASSAVSEELANCKYEIMMLEGQVKEKTKLLSDLQTKFESVEKEYLFLYDQQQKTESPKP